MPNRIIRESIRESYSVDQLSVNSEVLFYRLITYADDFGLFKSDPRLVNKALFPLKDYREKQVILWLDDVAKTGMIFFYVGSDGKPYGKFTNWEVFQQQRTKKPKHPEPEENNRIFHTIEGMEGEIKRFQKQLSDSNGYQMISDDIRCCDESNPNPNPKRKEKKNIVEFADAKPDQTPPEKPKKSRVEKNSSVEVFTHWQTVMNHPRSKLGDKRRKAINARLKEGYTVDDLKRAVDGCLHSAFHMGDNKDGTVFDDIELICRDASQVDKFLKLANAPPAKAVLTAAGRKAVNAAEVWMAKKKAEDGGEASAQH